MFRTDETIRALGSGCKRHSHHSNFDHHDCWKVFTCTLVSLQERGIS
jgi:hypothetical protein